MIKKILLLLIIILTSLSCNLPFSGDTPLIPPAETPTSTPIPTNTAIPTATPTPTPVPAVRIHQGDWALFLGDYTLAEDEYQKAYLATSDQEAQAAALIGFGRVQMQSQKCPDAIETLNQIIQDYPDTKQLSNAYYFLGECYTELEDYAQAANAFDLYLMTNPGVIDSYMYERKGDSLSETNMYAEAIQAYQSAIQAPHSENTTYLDIKIGQTYLAQEDYNSAIRQFTTIYENTNNDYIKAQANYHAGQAYLALGIPEQAYARFQDSALNYPLSYYAYLGLIELVDAGESVSDLDRGIVDYYANQYGVAFEALNRYANSTTEHDGTVYHYKALSLRAMERYEEAITAWDTLIKGYPGEQYWVAAWEEKAYTQWALMGQYSRAIETLLSFVSTYPNTPQAPEFLYTAGRIMEIDNRLQDAAATWERLIDEYPTVDISYKALFLAGIAHYRMGDYVKAQVDFQRILVLATSGSEQAAAYLWIGKSQLTQGDSEGARQSWQNAAQIDPSGYYSERAEELINGEPPFTISNNYELEYDLEQERGDAEAWMRTTFAIPDEVDLSTMGSLANDERLQRAKEFWNLGLYTEALNEYETIRLEYQNDPINTYRLIAPLLELGFYRSAIFASRNILDLAHMDNLSTLNAPIFFNHIRFGTYFEELILPAAEKENFHPMLLFSVIRQESFFEGFVQSSAGARGLMQIIPSTGQEIVTTMGWPPEYTEQDLYRPYINVRLGTRYLARQRDYFEGDLYIALAAYNGGPGNAIQWKQLSNGDPDLFLEVIRFSETHDYITYISENLHIYRRFYEVSQ